MVLNLLKRYMVFNLHLPIAIMQYFPTVIGPEEQQTIRQILHSHIDPYNRHIGKAVFQGFLVHQLSAKPVHLNDGSILQQGLHHQLSSLSLSPVITAKKPPLINTADLEGQCKPHNYNS